MKLGKELYLLKVFLVFKLIESPIATFLLVCKLYRYGLYIMHYILEVSGYTNIVYVGIYLGLTYIERLSRLHFLSNFAGH